MESGDGTARKRDRAARQRLIVDHILEHGHADIAELISLTGVSTMTVHRDLDDLASRGLARRVHGGVSALPTSVFESSSEFRMQRHIEEKELLARTAVEFIDSGMSIMIDDSTTAYALARHIPHIGDVTVISNYRRVLDLLKDTNDVRLIMLGGEYSRTHDSFIGPPSETGLTTYATDVVFLSTSTINTDTAFHQEQDVVMMKRGMLRCGTRRVLMVDSSKVGRTSLHHFAALDEFTDVILTSQVPQATMDKIAEHASVHVAS